MLVTIVVVNLSIRDGFADALTNFSLSMSCHAIYVMIKIKEKRSSELFHPPYFSRASIFSQQIFRLIIVVCIFP